MKRRVDEIMGKSSVTSLTAVQENLRHIEDLPVELTALQQLYVYWRSMGLTPALAYKRLEDTTPHSNWRFYEHAQPVREALKLLREELENDYRVTRGKVTEIILEAVEIARRTDQPKVMLDAARILNSMEGYSEAPEPKRIQDKSHYKAIRTYHDLPPAQLERIVGEKRTLSIIDAEVISEE